MHRKFRTSKGITKTSGSMRRYIVVNPNSGTILYRSDRVDRAFHFARKNDGLEKEVIDLEFGVPATQPNPFFQRSKEL